MEDYYKKYIEDIITDSREAIKNGVVDGKNPYVEIVVMAIDLTHNNEYAYITIGRMADKDEKQEDSGEYIGVATVLKIEKDLLTEMIEFAYRKLEEQENKTV